MPLDPMIARPYVPDVSNTLGEIARLKVADQYRQAQVAQDQQQFDYRKQRDAQADAEDDENDLAFDALSAQAKQAFDQGGYQAAFPILLQASRYHSDAAAMLDTHYRAEEERKKPKLPDYKVVGDTMLEMPTAPGQDPREVYRAPQKPQQYGPESFQPFTQADGSVVMTGSRGTVRPTDLKGQVKTDPEQTKKADNAASNQQAFEVYQAGMSGLTTAMDGAETGPLAGRLPAFTAAQQTADGAVAAMAPVLKQLFRSAGEGVFTDRDQEMLIEMLPTRKDHPEARAAKFANINRIVEAKLGISADASASGGPPANLLKEGKVTKFKNGQKWTLRNGQPVQVQ
jgi:hypothetical protein